MRLIGTFVAISAFVYLVSPKALGQGSGGNIAPVVLTGQPAPGFNGAVFTALGRPSINKSGVISFRASVTATEVSYDAFKGKLTPSGIFQRRRVRSLA